MTASLPADNGSAVPLRDIPEMDFHGFRSLVLEEIAGGAHLAAFFPLPEAGGERRRLFAILADPGAGGLLLASARVGGSFPSLTPEAPEAHLFEREMAEEWGVVPAGHPWLKPVRSANPPGSSPGASGPAGPAAADFFRMDGEEIHEVAVGPVHAGVIEPGHFRFQCHGEKVFHLEISLGYQHRGIERALRGGPDRLTIHRMETAAGDTTCGHALAYAMNVEALAGLDVSAAAWRARAAALELERLANHVGDLGALAGDVGFLPTASFCGRLRGDFLNLTAALCGNRFGRGFIVPGGVGARVERPRAAEALARLAAAARDARGAVGLLFKTPSAMARFEDVGRLGRDTANQIGLVGPAARASGLARDVRIEFPVGPYSRDLFEIPLGDGGDVMARARIRRAEIDDSLRLAEAWLDGDCDEPPPDRFREPSLRPDSLAVSLTEGWRGEICHVAVTDAAGRFASYKIVDPSFHNWFGLALALRGQQISDFPLCNKSFNLSYCGHDL